MRLITCQLAYCSASQGVAALAYPVAAPGRVPWISFVMKTCQRASRCSKAEIVALTDHPDRDHAYSGPRVEPGVERAQCRGPRRQLDEAEVGGEESAAKVGAGHGYSRT